MHATVLGVSLTLQSNKLIAINILNWLSHTSNNLGSGLYIYSYSNELMNPYKDIKDPSQMLKILPYRKLEIPLQNTRGIRKNELPMQSTINPTK